MFLTKDDLKLSYGVDLTIAQSYVNRAVPVQNLYWKDRMIYLPAAPGYIFMPIFADILLRSGVGKETILDENHFLVQEKILHSAALHEYRKITWSEHIADVKEIAGAHQKDPTLFGDLVNYLGQSVPKRSEGAGLGTGFPSLNRADSYLFSLVHLDPITYDQSKAIRGWYSLMSYFLIMDDLADIREDLKHGEDNVLTEAGVSKSGIEKVDSMLKESMLTMMEINPVMGNRIDHKMSVIDLHAIVRSITSV